jgi:XTP/dITP diphosphohydrolase
LALIFVTGNDHKFAEAKTLARPYGLELVQKNVPYVEIQAERLEDIVKVGVQQACALLRQPCFVEDAGLFVESLNGFPGPYSKFVFLTIGNEGLLKLLEGKKNRAAEFKSAVAYCEPGQKPEVFAGLARGRISLEPRGTGGFGFDPIFEVEGGGGKTFAEMSTEEKNRFSHRGRALAALMQWLKGRGAGKG